MTGLLVGHRSCILRKALFAKFCTKKSRRNTVLCWSAKSCSASPVSELWSQGLWSNSWFSVSEIAFRHRKSAVMPSLVVLPQASQKAERGPDSYSFPLLRRAPGFGGLVLRSRTSQRCRAGLRASAKKALPFLAYCDSIPLHTGRCGGEEDNAISGGFSHTV